MTDDMWVRVGRDAVSLDLPIYQQLGRPAFVRMVMHDQDLMIIPGGARGSGGHPVRLFSQHPPTIRFKPTGWNTEDKLRIGPFPAVVETQSGHLACRVCGCTAYRIDGYERI